MINGAFPIGLGTVAQWESCTEISPRCRWEAVTVNAEADWNIS